MQLTRRELFIGMIGTIVANALPLPSLAAPMSIRSPLGSPDPSVLEVLLQNLRNDIDALDRAIGFPHPSGIGRHQLKILEPMTAETYNRLLVTRLVPHEAMTGPVHLIDDEPVRAKTRKLSARWTFEHAYDGKVPEGLEEYLIANLASEAAAEMNQEHLRFMRQHASVGETVSPDADLRKAIKDAAAKLAPRGNWAVVSASHLWRLGISELPRENGTITPYNFVDYEPVTDVDGIAVFFDRYGHDEAPTLIGHSDNDSFVWAPYVLLRPSGVVINPNTFEPTMGFYTRFGTKEDTRRMNKHFITLPHESPDPLCSWPT